MEWRHPPMLSWKVPRNRITGDDEKKFTSLSTPSYRRPFSRRFSRRKPSKDRAKWDERKKRAGSRSLLRVKHNDIAIQDAATSRIASDIVKLFSVKDIIRNLDGLHIIGGFLSHPDLKIKAGALNALNNLSMNLQNQEQIQAFINEVLKNITESALNSEVQLAGLRLLINMSVTNNYHEKMVDYIPNLLHVLDGGNDTTKIHVLKVLVNLSANPLMSVPLLAAKAPSALICLFDSSNTRDVLIRALTFSANLSENLGREQQCAGQARYKEDSLYAVLFEDPAALQRNLAPLLLFPDTEIKEQVKRCISAVRSKNS
ncbi:unnamed protein product [Ranitomeya imitator]|uniref:Armadillo repeat-containing domain-containing protein n=1 Tax=Ranitomeya imitator TaxID=111125 RepID=A0ABN9LTX8_9NEOB|nr:unnamed protein product [Ranitomeya imitator]